MAEKPKSTSQQELDKVEKQFEQFDSQVKSMTLDHMNTAPNRETELQTKIAQADIDKDNGTYLKPYRTIGSREKFNENYRNEYNHAKEYVNFTAENREIIGETIDIWTKPFAGLPAEWWKVPVNKPLWGPRYLAEQIKSARYHKLTMANKVSTGMDGMGEYYGTMAVDSVVQRLDAMPVSSKKSIFMGANSFG